MDRQIKDKPIEGDYIASGEGKIPVDTDTSPEEYLEGACNRGSYWALKQKERDRKRAIRQVNIGIGRWIYK